MRPMRLVFEDKQKRIIRGQEEIGFSSFSSFHLFIVSARAKSKKQISPEETDDEDLYLKIDGKTFPKLTEPKRRIDSPAAFSGGTLHNLAKTVYYLVFLKGKEHFLFLTTDAPHKSAGLENIRIYTVNLSEEITVEVED